MRALRMLLAMALLLSAGPARAEDYEAVESRYRALLTRPAFYKRAQGWLALARTRDPRALARLRQDYVRPEEPRDYTRYLIVTYATRYLDARPDFRDEYAAWRARHDDPADAWLWYRSLGVDLKLRGETALAVARDPARSVWLRSCALRAVIDGQPPRALEAAGAALAAGEGKGGPPGLLVEAAATALSASATRLREGEFGALARTVIAHLDRKDVSERTRRVIARHLASVFRTDVLALTSEPWLRELEAAQATAGGGGGAEPPRYAKPTFFGLEATGKHVVYVIDCSDSMLTPLTGVEKNDLKRRTPVTPGDGPAKPSARKGEYDDIPWEHIHNRFEAAREVLKRAIQGLTKGDSFAVVLFGDEAEWLPTTRGLVAVAKSSIAGAVADLDAVKPGPPAESRPHGVLRGRTNLHGALRLAYRGLAGKVADGPEYVDAKGLEQGADTIFVLSDGDPTWDDWPTVDARDPEDHAGDPESREKRTDTPTLHFMGPFGSDTLFDLLRDEARRLNLFRQAEIHCVAIGEVSDYILKEWAHIGMGRFVRVGVPDAPK